MAANRPPGLHARPPDRAVQAPDDARRRVAAGGHADRARPAVPRQARARRRDPATATSTRSRHRRPVRGRRAREHGHERRADLLHRLDRRADPRRPPEQALPPPPGALARLLRAQPRRRDHQPADERRGRARPAGHRRRHDTRPEHADPRRLRRRPLLPRLAARARDAERDAGDGDRHGRLPDPVVSRVPAGARPSRPRHGHARGGHRRHARRPDLHPGAVTAPQLRGGQRPLPRGEPADGPEQRPLLPVRRLPLGGRDRGRPRLRRLPRWPAGS